LSILSEVWLQNFLRSLLCILSASFSAGSVYKSIRGRDFRNPQIGRTLFPWCRSCFVFYSIASGSKGYRWLFSFVWFCDFGWTDGCPGEIFHQEVPLTCSSTYVFSSILAAQYFFRHSSNFVLTRTCPRFVCTWWGGWDWPIVSCVCFKRLRDPQVLVII
jgi:hypothetical protein